MNTRGPIEPFPPGVFIRDEMEARGWTQEVLAEILGRPQRLVSELITGKRGITPETAHGLGEAFGTGPQVWMNLESAYRLSLVRNRGDAVARRSKIYGKAPVREMIRRRWIEPSESLEVLEQRVLTFLRIESLDAPLIPISHTARKGTGYESVTPAQCAWLGRAMQLAPAVSAQSYSPIRLRDAMKTLRILMQEEAEVRHVPRVLADAGVRFVVIEHLPQSKIDGWAFWLDQASPVVALSLRYDRIDYFWYTLAHELHHILLDRPKPGEHSPFDAELVGEGAIPMASRPPREQRVDAATAEYILSRATLQDFVDRNHPLYSKVKIRSFARLHGVHPGVVVGQLHHMDRLPFTHNREMLVKVRSIITSAALTDGWGSVVGVEVGGKESMG